MQGAGRDFDLYGVRKEVPYSKYLNLGFSVEVSSNYVYKLSMPDVIRLDVFGKFLFQPSGTFFGLYGVVKLGIHTQLAEPPLFMNGFSFPAGIGYTTSGLMGFDYYFNKWIGCFIEGGLQMENIYYRIYETDYLRGPSSLQGYYVLSRVVSFGIKTTL
jgi:hypothetical protein